MTMEHPLPWGPMVINVEILFVTEKHQTPGGLGRRTKHEAPRGVPDLTVRDLTALPRDVAASAEVTAHRRCGRCVATEAQLPRNRTARSVARLLMAPRPGQLRHQRDDTTPAEHHGGSASSWKAWRCGRATFARCLKLLEVAAHGGGRHAEAAGDLLDGDAVRCPVL